MPHLLISASAFSLCFAASADARSAGAREQQRVRSGQAARGWSIRFSWKRSAQHAKARAAYDLESYGEFAMKIIYDNGEALAEACRIYHLTRKPARRIQRTNEHRKTGR